MSQIQGSILATSPRVKRLKWVQTMSLAAVLAASAAVIPQTAEARHGGGFHGGGFHGGGFHGGPGRWWGGRYYGYGAGPCWRWNPFYARWIWACY